MCQITLTPATRERGFQTVADTGREYCPIFASFIVASLGITFHASVTFEHSINRAQAYGRGPKPVALRDGVVSTLHVGSSARRGHVYTRVGTVAHGSPPSPHVP